MKKTKKKNRGGRPPSPGPKRVRYQVTLLAATSDYLCGLDPTGNRSAAIEQLVAEHRREA